MCTRFYIDRSQEEIASVIELAYRSPLTKKFLAAGDPMITGGEIRPTNVVPVIAPDPTGKTSVYPMKWGFTDKEHGNILFNARSESAGKKPTFRELWTARRCVIPASYYFEWKRYEHNGRIKTGAKYTVQPRNSETAWLCGLYRRENRLPVFVILTRDAVGDLLDLHDRMPVIIPKERISEWVRPQNNPAAVLTHAVTDMVNISFL